MCGRLNVIDDYGVRQLCEQLRIPLGIEPELSRRFTRATDKVAIITRKQEQNVITPAIWWLLLEPTEDGFKPSKYTSFNTRYDKLNVPKSAGFKPYRQSRCLVPAKGFGESEFQNKKPLHYHDFEATEGQAIVFGGLYREWIHSVTGELVTSCSIITLPPHEKLAPYHSKSMPLIMPHDMNLFEAWLDPTFNDVRQFEYLLSPYLPQDLIVQQIDKPSLHNPISEAKVINGDG